MRVLLLHNRYRAEGGEERTVADLERLLRSRGHTVRSLERSSEKAGQLMAARGLLAGGIQPGEVGAAVRELGADVVHAHNLHPLLGWRALAAAREAGARTVLHLQNFRLFCAVAIGYRDGAPCFRCHGSDTWPGLRLRCRGSLPEAAVYAAGLHRQQPHLLEEAEQFIAVSEATALRLVELGLPAARTTVLHNFIPAAEIAAASRAAHGEHALISGRLVEEKGFDTAIAAARAAEVPLLVAGSGPDEARLRGLAAGARVTFTGRLERAALSDLRRRAAVVLVPSRWEEPCPYTALEALADGVPVLAADRGGLPELAGLEATLPAEDPQAWAQALRRLWDDPVGRQQAGEAGLVRARVEFSEVPYYERLMAIYEGQ
ncbi:MAG: glycosyltransferase family 4 protein [Solirubrobacteraceae bacterium]